MREYVRHTIEIPQVLAMLEPRMYQTHSLRSFWTMLIAPPGVAFGVYVASAVVVLVFTARCWNSSLPLGLRYSAVLLATVLVSPHLTVYDLVILAPALLLTVNWLVANPNHPSRHVIAILCYLVYLLPLVGPLARWTHVQLSVLAMVGLLCMVCRVAQRAAAENVPA
jgi:hypothetical protein